MTSLLVHTIVLTTAQSQRTLVHVCYHGNQEDTLIGVNKGLSITNRYEYRYITQVITSL